MITYPKILKDQFDRKHDYLRISLTERCNLRCFYCMPPEGLELHENDAYMTAKEVISIATTFKKLGVKKIRLTGGEPLVRKDFEQIVLGLSELGIELAITTNGILLDRYQTILKKSGCNSINISLDTFKKEKMAMITRRDYFERIMNNLKNVISDTFFKVKLNAVIVKGINDDEIIDFCNFTKSNAVQFRFIEFMPFKGNGWKRDASMPHIELLQILRNKYGNTILPLIAKENATSSDFFIEGHKGSIGLISSVSNAFCGTCNRMRLTANGKMKNCLFSREETDLLGALRSGRNLEELIQSNVFSKHLMRGGMDTDEKINNPGYYEQNRSMVSIGG